MNGKLTSRHHTAQAVQQSTREKPRRHGGGGALWVPRRHLLLYPLHKVAKFNSKPASVAREAGEPCETRSRCGACSAEAATRPAA